MKTEINQNGIIEISEVYNSINLRTNAGENLTICMRDSGFEFQYEGEWYFAKEGFIEPMKKSDRGNLLVEQKHTEEAEVAVGCGTADVIGS